MKLLLFAVAVLVLVPSSASMAQAAPAVKAKAPAAATKAVPPFSGTWVLNLQRSKLTDRVTGVSKAVIEFDGKTWRYIHTHADGDDALPDSWQRTMVVGAAAPHVEAGEEITFRSYMKRVGNNLVLTETGMTAHGQHLRNTVTYSLTDGDNTLVQTEVSVGPLGPRKNVYVLERQVNGEPVGVTHPVN